MTITKKTKRSIEFYLSNFATWLNKAEYDPAITRSAGKKSARKKVVQVNLKYDPKLNISGFSNKLSETLKSFIKALTSNPYHHEKLAKETKKKLGNLHMHLQDALENRDTLGKGKTSTVRALEKLVASSLNKVKNFLNRIVLAKHQIKSKKEKGYSDPHHPQSLIHLTKDNRYKKDQVPLARRSGKTQRGGHNN